MTQHHIHTLLSCSLDPERDPLCVLLMIDYFAVRACEYKFLLDLFKAWEVCSQLVVTTGLTHLLQSHRNLSQLPNFAYSVPLAMFHLASHQGTEAAVELIASADDLLQNALIMFPSVSDEGKLIFMLKTPFQTYAYVYMYISF